MAGRQPNLIPLLISFHQEIYESALTAVTLVL